MHLTDLTHFNPLTFWGRIALSLGITILYVLGFVSLHSLLGPGGTALSLIPVSVVAGLFGVRGGLVAGPLSVALNILLIIYLVGDTLTLRGGFVPGSFALMVVGVFIGRIHDLGERVKQELTERQRVEAEREKVIVELREALDRVKTLSGLLPICAHCKKIRDYAGYWQQVEGYISDHSDIEFSHGICPDCLEKQYALLEGYKTKLDLP